MRPANFILEMILIVIESLQPVLSFRSKCLVWLEKKKLNLNSSVGNLKGTLVATSEDGLTVFDLFGEILTIADMKQMIQENDIPLCDFTNDMALGIRCFMLFLDLASKTPKTESIVKVEEVDPDPIETDGSVDFFVPSVEDAESPKKRKFQNLCKGPGCNCKEPFPSKEEKEKHYIQKGCYACDKCETKLPSQKELGRHIESHMKSGFGKSDF